MITSRKYYGRIDYTCPKTIDKEVDLIIPDLIVSILRLINAIFKNINQKFKIWLKSV